MLFGFLFVQLRRHTQLNIMKVLRGGRFAMNCSKGTLPISSGNSSWTTHFVVECARWSAASIAKREKKELRVCISRRRHLALVIWLRLSRIATPRRVASAKWPCSGELLFVGCWLVGRSSRWKVLRTAPVVRGTRHTYSCTCRSRRG